MKVIYSIMWCFALVPTTAVAQNNPLDPHVNVPTTNYQSTFSDYQKYQEVKSNQWKAVNKSASEHGMSMGDMMGDGMKMDNMDSHDMKNMHEMDKK